MNALMRLVLKSSVAAILAAGVVSGCGSDKDDNDNGGEAGEPSNGGSDNTAGTKSNEGGGGTDAAGGTTNGGLNPGGSSSGGEKTAGGEASGGAPPQGGATGSAVAKFCNSIVLTTDDGEGGAGQVDHDTTFRLELGEGDDVVTLTATTGECAPMDGEACTPIPVGDVPYKLIYIAADTEVETELDFGSVPMIADGEEWYFWSEIFEENPVLAGGAKPALVCAEATFNDIVPAE